MANWCNNEIMISGNDKDIHNLHELLKKWENEFDSDKDYYEFRDILEKAKIEPLNSITESYNGYVEKYFVDEDNNLCITAVTKWEPMNDVWYLLAQKYVEDWSLSFVSCEPMMGIFLTNDSSVIGLYNVNVYDKDGNFKKEYYQCDEVELDCLIKDTLNTEWNNHEELMEELNNSDYKEMFDIQEWEEYQYNIPTYTGEKCTSKVLNQKKDKSEERIDNSER